MILNMRGSLPTDRSRDERLKLLLITGKSGMMLPGTAWVSPGQFKKLGSVILTRVNRPRSSVATQCTHGPRHASAHPSAAESAGSASGMGDRSGVSGSMSSARLHDEKGLLDLPRAP